MRKFYSRWRMMVARCHDEKRKDYKYYGAKGIRVCREWRKFVNFIEWFDRKYRILSAGIPGDIEVKCDIDRIDPRRGYNPDNCRLVNHRTNVLRCIKRDRFGRFSRTRRVLKV